FTTATVAIVPPTMAIQKATPSLRMFAGPGQYDRTQIATVDTNQSWMGGSYPVSYSFTISDYTLNPTINELHEFFIPLNYDSGGVLNQYTDYSTAANNFRLLITGGAAGTSTMYAQLDWKTNLVNANPDHVILNVTNDTGIGTWTMTFNSATSGTLTAPGAAPAAFSLPAEVASQFANPLVVFLGVQPDPVANIGQHVDFTKFQTANVAAPGVPVNADFSTWSTIDSNLLLTASVSAAGNRLVLASTNDAWWVNWTYPDYNTVLATRPALSGTVPWKTPLFYNGSNTVYQGNMGPQVWSLIPSAGLPTVDGTTNGTKSANAFFRLSLPGPAQ
ncbi:MAG TPA: hypothetical protein VKA67_07120, partial [Verrucomicrobiae bacterium]|nr:hypothetical protein [Verrucomicrobiae bacterium]